MSFGRNGLTVARGLTRQSPRVVNRLQCSRLTQASSASIKTPCVNDASARRCLTTSKHHHEQLESLQGESAWITSPDASHQPRDIENIDKSSIDCLKACPGCGGYAQIIEPNVAGFYNLKRAAVQKFVQAHGRPDALQSKEDAVFAEAVCNVSDDLQKSLSADASVASNENATHPLCDRCHDLLHHHRGTSIAHPSLQSLGETLAESPYKNNHVYHVLDAADFPMSLVPNIRQILSVAPQRSRNRRAHQTKYSGGRKTEISFIITRSDLLAPRKEQVDRLMPYIVETLRTALGRAARDVRLGNVRCVSAKRGWWTKEVKTEVWKSGGGGWMVGKVNVGKSKLFEVIFPKGRNEDVNFNQVRAEARSVSSLSGQKGDSRATVSHEEGDLLPPARAETAYPMMPIVSSLPGTTASPIRIPFGNGKGELIDLPGLQRSNISTFVRDEHQEDIVMRKRIVPEQFSIRPGSSLLLGGLIRITPINQFINVLAYPFTPLEPHMTKNEKAVRVQTGDRAPIPFITKEGVSENLQAAGVFYLDTDVTKSRSGPLVAKDAVGMKPQNLPFKVLATDILIESIGWVELVAQVRRKDFPDEGPPSARAGYPAVEVFSPEGRFVASRKSMGAWALGGAKKATPRKRVQPVNRKLKDRRAASSAV